MKQNSFLFHELWKMFTMLHLQCFRQLCVKKSKLEENVPILPFYSFILVCFTTIFLGWRGIFAVSSTNF